MRFFLIYISCFICIHAFGQINGVDRIIIAAGGNGDLTIGESVLSIAPNNNPSIANYFLVGFQQPEPSAKTTVSPNLFTANGEIKNQVSCIGNKDGQYRIKLSNVDGGVTIVLKNIDNSSIDTLVNQKNYTAFALEYPIDGLGKGEYQVVINYISSANNATSKIESFQIIENNNLCDIKPYTGITPNSDGKNDIWIIEGINNYEKNEVELFNRWGQTIWKQKGYNNGDIVFKGLTNAGEKVSSGTYFFVISVAENVNPIKGWLEIIAQ